MRVIIVLSLLSHLFYLTECKCDSFQNVDVTAIPVEGKNFNVIVNDCIEPELFGGRAIRGIYAKKQNIRHLNTDSIKDMDQLEAVSFDECSIKNVEVGAFKNVPRLREIFLVKSYIPEIPTGVFNDLSLLFKIRLDNNSIQVIQKQAFAGLPALTKVYASHNKLEYWDSDWFTNSMALKKINFEHNLIQKIPKDAFKYLPNLSKINFNYNNISFIEMNAFEGIHHLQYLGLRYNRLTVIDPEIFPNAIQIDSLFIDANQLNYIPRQTLTQLTVKNVTLDGNPWSCPCLVDISLWLGITNGKVKTSKHCRGGDTYQCVQYHNECKQGIDDDITRMYFDVVRPRIETNTLSRECVRID